MSDYTELIMNLNDHLSKNVRKMTSKNQINDVVGDSFSMAGEKGA